jgi:hypothetical protein
MSKIGIVILIHHRHKPIDGIYNPNKQYLIKSRLWEEIISKSGKAGRVCNIEM